MVHEIYEDKRDFSRMRIDTSVSFTILGKGDKIYPATSQNLSATGIYMTTQATPELNDEIKLTILSNNDSFPPFEAVGKVVRCIVDEKETDLFHVSVSLTETR